MCIWKSAGLEGIYIKQNQLSERAKLQVNMVLNMWIILQIIHIHTYLKVIAIILISCVLTERASD